MCGIAGIVELAPGQRRSNRDVVGTMISRLDHRGPDHQGFFADQSAALGIARLSIIDLSGGNQPIANEDESTWVVQNGEIYNYRELRQELWDAGHVFRTNSDTEVIVHAYEQWGDACVERLRGMFAFAIWDAHQGRLLIGRDRLGEKPLHYAQVGGRFVFASEIKALLEIAGIGDQIDPVAVDEYLSYGYISSPRSIFAEIRKLSPAHLLVVEKGRVSTRPYWRPPSETSRLSFDEAREAVLPVLRDAVRSQMISDAPLGAFLSGGVDSSVIAALMVEASTSPIRTFCVGFEESEFDERPYARQVANHLGTEHEEWLLRPDVAAILPDLVRHFDEPFADKSLVPTFAVAQAAVKHVKVVLSGDGGDEVFGGYVSYAAAARRRARESVRPRAVNAAVRAAARRYPSWAPYGTRVRHRALDEIGRFAVGSYVFDPATKASLLSSDFGAALRDVDPLAFKTRFVAPGLEPTAQLQFNDLHHYLPDDILVKVDRMTMRASLEARAPLLDHRLVELVLPLSDELKIANGTSKRLLRSIAEMFVPQALLDRPKQGFALPVKAWLSSDLRALCADVLTGSALTQLGWFSPSALRALADGAWRTRGEVDKQQWSLLCLGLWAEGRR